MCHISYGCKTLYVGITQMKLQPPFKGDEKTSSRLTMWLTKTTVKLNGTED